MVDRSVVVYVFFLYSIIHYSVLEMYLWLVYHREMISSMIGFLYLFYWWYVCIDWRLIRNTFISVNQFYILVSVNHKTSSTSLCVYLYRKFVNLHELELLREPSVTLQAVTCAVGDLQRRNSLASRVSYDKPIPEEIIEEPVGLSLTEKIVGGNPRCSGCEAKGAVLCKTCTGSGLYVDSILESQGIIVKVRCLGNVVHLSFCFFYYSYFKWCKMNCTFCNKFDCITSEWHLK